jgi:predicted NUDIX family NTP pyrophosphohydrolase
MKTYSDHSASLIPSLSVGRAICASPPQAKSEMSRSPQYGQRIRNIWLSQRQDRQFGHFCPQADGVEQRHGLDRAVKPWDNDIPDRSRCSPCAMPQRSAGILMFRKGRQGLEVLLIHPGGPFWAKKDDGAWSIPKGLHGPDEDTLAAARREFEEETGCVPEGEFIPLGEFKPGAKLLTVYAVEGDFDLRDFKSNPFEMEWPPKSGRRQAFPEADRAGWFGIAEATRKILKGQLPIVAALVKRVEAQG